MKTGIKPIEISDLCHRVRDSIEKVKGKTSLLKSFPHGCCRDASLILSMILEHYGFADHVYCSKDIDDNSPSHAWLEYENHILDLTADQFGSEYLPVIVKRNTGQTAIHTRHRWEKPNLGIAGMDASALMADYRKIQQHIERYDVRLYLERYLPSLTDLLDGQNISWSPINQNFRNYVKKIRTELKDKGKSEIVWEATFFTILYRRQHGLGGTEAMFDFFDTLFITLKMILTEKERRPLHRMITRVLSSLGKGYLDFIGELATLRHFMATGEYELANIEEQIHPESGVSADIFLRRKSDGTEILVEVLNLHLESIEFYHRKHLFMHLISKFSEKAEAKCINPGRTVMIQPVFWTRDEPQIRFLKDFYTDSPLEMTYVEKPLCYASYRIGDTFEHRFSYIDQILD